MKRGKWSIGKEINANSLIAMLFSTIHLDSSCPIHLTKNRTTVVTASWSSCRVPSLLLQLVAIAVLLCETIKVGQRNLDLQEFKVHPMFCINFSETTRDAGLQNTSKKSECETFSENCR